MAMGVQKLQIHTDSQLVTCKISGDYKARDGRMAAYQEVIKRLLEKFEQVHVKLVPRDSNAHVDSLARLATSEGPIKMKEVTITRLPNPLTSYSLVGTLDSAKPAEEN